MKMNMKQWAQQLIADQKIAAVPIMTHPGIDMTGKRVLDAVSNGNVHFEAIKALADHYPTAAATVIMDLTVEAEAFGAEIAFDDDVVPAVMGHLLNNAEDICQLQVPPLNKARIPAYLKANLLAAKAISDRPVLAGCIGPFSLAGRLYDMSAIMMLIYEDPEAAELLLDKCTQFILKYCLALKATGANGVVMADPAAGLTTTVCASLRCSSDALWMPCKTTISPWCCTTAATPDIAPTPWWPQAHRLSTLATNATWNR